MPAQFDIYQQLGRKTQNDLRVKFRLWLGNMLLDRVKGGGDQTGTIGKAIATARYFKQLKEFDQVQENGMDRLSPSRVETLRSYDFSEAVLEGWHKTFTGNPESNIQWYVLPLIKKVLDNDPSVRSVLNIGVKIAYFDSELAKEYRDRKFIGVDFMRRVVEFNARYHQPNLELLSGYGLQMLENDEISADMVFFSSTAVIIRNRELRKYLSLIRKKAKYIIFNEPMYTFPNSIEIVDPSTVPLDKSYLIATPDIPPGYDPPAPENRSLCFVHNYAAMVEEAGFKVEHYEITMKDGALPLMRLIGKAK